MYETSCRVCLKEGDINIFDAENQSQAISTQMMACINHQYEISPGDGFPQKICKECYSQLYIAYQFHLRCLSSERQFRSLMPTKQDNVLAIKFKIYDDEFVYEDDTERNTKTDTVKKSYSIVTDEACKKTKSKYGAGYKCKDLDVNHTNVDKNDQQSARDPSNSPLSHMCPSCGKVFTHSSSLLTHQRVHTGERPYKCEHCDKSFIQLGHLASHTRTHTGEKPFNCKICTRAFSVAASLTKHLRTHSGERPYKCVVCGKSFVTSYHLSSHRKRHLGQKDFRCDWPDCSQKFINISDMKRHRVKHDKNNVKVRIKAR